MDTPEHPQGPNPVDPSTLAGNLLIANITELQSQIIGLISLFFILLFVTFTNAVATSDADLLIGQTVFFLNGDDFNVPMGLPFLFLPLVIVALFLIIDNYVEHLLRYQAQLQMSRENSFPWILDFLFSWRFSGTDTPKGRWGSRTFQWVFVALVPALLVVILGTLLPTKDWKFLLPALAFLLGFYLVHVCRIGPWVVARWRRWVHRLRHRGTKKEAEALFPLPRWKFKGLFWIVLALLGYQGLLLALGTAGFRVSSPAGLVRAIPVFAQSQLEGILQWSAVAERTRLNQIEAKASMVGWKNFLKVDGKYEGRNAIRGRAIRDTQMFAGGTFENLDFTNVTFYSVSFSETIFGHCVFDHVEIEQSFVTRVLFSDCRLVDSKLTNNETGGPSFQNTKLIRCTLSGYPFLLESKNGWHIWGSRNFTLQDSLVEDCTWEGFTLDEAHWSRNQIVNSRFVDTLFWQGTLTGNAFLETTFSAAPFEDRIDTAGFVDTTLQNNQYYGCQWTNTVWFKTSSVEEWYQNCQITGALAGGHLMGTHWKDIDWQGEWRPQWIESSVFESSQLVLTPGLDIRSRLMPATTLEGETAGNFSRFYDLERRGARAGLREVLEVPLPYWSLPSTWGPAGPEARNRAMVDRLVAQGLVKVREQGNGLELLPRKAQGSRLSRFFDQPLVVGEVQP